MIKAEWTSNDALSAEQTTQTNAPNALNVMDCVSRKASIEAISELHDKPNAWLDLAVDALEDLPSAQPAPRWIPVTEKPKKNGEYLVTKIDHITHNRLVDIAQYGNFIPYNNGFYKADEIVAWMPLPEPYREETVDVKIC